MFYTPVTFLSICFLYILGSDLLHNVTYVFRCPFLPLNSFLGLFSLVLSDSFLDSLD